MLRLQTPLPERYTTATPDELERAHRRGQGDPRRPRCSSSATTTSATRSCAGPTPGATRYRLSVLAQQRPEAEFIVFCGVHFMAESADVLTDDHQQVILPDLNAGCSMADMADIDEVEEAWEALGAVIDIERLVPDHLHELVGRAEGVRRASTAAPSAPRPTPGPSSSGPSAEGDKVLFFPDQHLGRNTGLAMGYGHDDMRVWNPRFELGGLTEADCKEATFLLWKGHCSVHQRFRPEHVAAFRAEHPDGIVVAHPECSHERVRHRRPGRLDRLHHQGGRGRAGPASTHRRSAPRSTSCSGWPTSTPTRRSSRSTR